MNVARIADLLDRLGRLAPAPETRHTFMEIAGYPHYENVCSNILAYFADPASGHGLGDVVLNSLLQAAGEAIQPGSISGVEVEREVQTEKGRRIDIVALTDELVIGIENKIFASLYNELPDYRVHLDTLSRSDRRVVGIVLTLRPESVDPASGFVAITYDRWFDRLLGSLGQAALRADLQQLAILLDFITTIQNLSKGSTMNEELMKLLRERGPEVNEFLREVDKVQRELRDKVKQVGEMIEPLPGVIRGYWRDRSQLIDYLYNELEWPNNQRIAVDCVLTPAGWEVVLMNRRGSSVDIQGLIDRLGFTATPWPPIPARLAIAELRFNYADDLAVKTALEGLLQRLVELRPTEAEVSHVSAQRPDPLS